MIVIHSFQKRNYAVFSNNNAFTLIEVLVSLTIFTTIAFFMTPLFQIILDPKDNEAELQAMQWDIFCNQIKKEIRLSTRVEAAEGRLILTKGTETIQYERYQNSLRRRVNASGHEILLQNVAEHAFSIKHNTVIVAVRDIWGKEYSVTVYPLVNWSGGP